MYGKIYESFESDKEGYLYVLPRGYSLYSHEIVNVTDNLDGSYTVVTNVEISLDDGTVINDTASTVFLKNTKIKVLHSSPSGDPRAYFIKNTTIAIIFFFSPSINLSSP